MEISARNQLRGTVKKVTRGGVNGEVVVDIGGQEMVSSITCPRLIVWRSRWAMRSTRS